MKRIRVILAVGLAPVAWLACGSVPAADCRPNLVIILADQQSPHVLGCAGDRVVRTPHLDRLAAGGVRFTATYCGSPLCVPSRMTFLTARHCSQIGVWSNGCLLDSETPTFPGALAAAGYDTVLAGRMHFAGPDQRHGFTRRTIGDVGQPRLAGGGRPSLLGSIPRATTGQSKEAVETAGPGRTSYMAYDDAVTGSACKFLAERDRQSADKPFALVVGYVLPHCPYICPPELRRMLKAIEQAGREGVQILALPEMCLPGYFTQSAGTPAEATRANHELADRPGQSEFIQRLREAARDKKMVLAFGFCEREGDRYYNAIGVIDADGAWLGTCYEQSGDPWFYQKSVELAYLGGGLRVLPGGRTVALGGTFDEEWRFRVPRGTAAFRLASSDASRLVLRDPAGREASLTPLGSGQYRVAVTDVAADGLWSVSAQEVADVAFADIQPVFANRVPTSYFEPAGARVKTDLPPAARPGESQPRPPASGTRAPREQP